MTPQTRPPHLSTRPVRDWLAQDIAPRLIDVRTPAEFETLHIPGSYNVPLHLLQEHRTELARHLDDVVLVCRSGQRAGARPNAAFPTPACPAYTSSTAASPPGRPPGHRSTTAGPAGTSNGRYAWSPAAWCCSAILGSLLLPGLQWLAAAIGAGLATAALTNTCLMGMLLAKLPYNQGAACDLDSVVRHSPTPVPARDARPDHRRRRRRRPRAGAARRRRVDPDPAHPGLPGRHAHPAGHRRVPVRGRRHQHRRPDPPRPRPARPLAYRSPVRRRRGDWAPTPAAGPPT